MSAAEYFVAALGWALVLYFQQKAARLQDRLERLTDGYLEVLSELRKTQRPPTSD